VSVGNLFRKVQSGQLQGYAFAIGSGAARQRYGNHRQRLRHIRSQTGMGEVGHEACGVKHLRGLGPLQNRIAEPREGRRQVDRDRARVAGVCVEIPGRDHRQHDVYVLALDRETVASLVVATPGDMGHARRAGRERR
jgi:hypothetical protein